MIVGHNTFLLMLYIVTQRKVTTSLEKCPFFCYNRSKKEVMCPEFSLGFIFTFSKISIDFTPNYNDIVAVEGGQRYDDHQRIRYFMWLQHADLAVL